jgi:hypothetical protein
MSVWISNKSKRLDACHSWSTLDQQARTSIKKVLHSADETVRVGPEAFFESRMDTVSLMIATSTQAPPPLAMLFFHRRSPWSFLSTDVLANCSDCRISRILSRSGTLNSVTGQSVPSVPLVPTSWCPPSVSVSCPCPCPATRTSCHPPCPHQSMPMPARQAGWRSTGPRPRPAAGPGPVPG